MQHLYYNLLEEKEKYFYWSKPTLGEGLSKVPTTLIELEKAKPEGVTEQVRQATDAEKTS